jgi:hypothetical protein
MIDARITKITDTKALIFWEEDGFYGNIKIEYNGKGGFNVDSEYIDIETFLKIMRNVSHENT